MRRPRALAAVLFAGTALLPGCNTPSALPVFCGAASATLTEAAPILRDLGGSCLRAKTLEADPARFTAITSDPACDAVTQQAEGAVAAAALLSRYFDALNALAAPASLKVGDDTNTLATEASAAFRASPSAQAAIGSIAGFLANAATAHTTQKMATRDIAQVGPNITAITDALTAILQTNYLHQELDNEDGKLTVHYRDLARQHPGDTLLALHLNERWQVEHDRLTERRASAEVLLTSLGTLKAAVAQLASAPRPLKSDQVSALLTPYTVQLQTAIPAIQKAF